MGEETAEVAKETCERERRNISGVGGMGKEQVKEHKKKCERKKNISGVGGMGKKQVKEQRKNMREKETSQA